MLNAPADVTECFTGSLLTTVTDASAGALSAENWLSVIVRVTASRVGTVCVGFGWGTVSVGDDVALAVGELLGERDCCSALPRLSETITDGRDGALVFFVDDGLGAVVVTTGSGADSCGCGTELGDAVGGAEYVVISLPAGTSVAVLAQPAASPALRAIAVALLRIRTEIFISPDATRSGDVRRE